MITISEEKGIIVLYKLNTHTKAVVRKALMKDGTCDDLKLCSQQHCPHVTQLSIACEITCQKNIKSQ